VKQGYDAPGLTGFGTLVFRGFWRVTRVWNASLCEPCGRAYPMTIAKPWLRPTPYPAPLRGAEAGWQPRLKFYNHEKYIPHSFPAMKASAIILGPIREPWSIFGI
jgi:hypothetical protein